MAEIEGNSRVQPYGAADQVRLQRLDVTMMKTIGHRQRPQGQSQRPDQQHGVGALRSQHQHRGDGTAADRIAQPLESDIDDGLGRPLLLGRHRCVKQLVAGAEQRVSQHHLHPARNARAQEPWCQQHAEAAARDGDRQYGHGLGEPQPVEREAAERGLDQERKQCNPGIEP